MIYDPHWEIKNIAVHAFKGALLGALAGGLSFYSTRNIPTYALQKMLNFAKDNTFGTGM